VTLVSIAVEEGLDISKWIEVEWRMHLGGGARKEYRPGSGWTPRCRSGWVLAPAVSPVALALGLTLLSVSP
jgi:hypothetical protein